MACLAARSQDAPARSNPAASTRLSDGHPVQLRWVLVEVIGKTTEPGWLWGTWYKVACRILGSSVTYTCPATFDQYASMHKGQRFHHLLESSGEDRWCVARDKYDPVPPLRSPA